MALISHETIKNGGNFAQIYFYTNSEGELKTSLEAGMLIVAPQNQYAIITAVQYIGKNVKIEVFNPILFITTVLQLSLNIHIRTYRRQSFNCRRIQIGERVLALGMYTQERLPLDASHGTIQEIFEYDEVEAKMFLIQTPIGMRAFHTSLLQFPIRMYEDENAHELTRRLLSVGIGTHVLEGTVVAVLYFGALPKLPHYAIRGMNGKMIFRKFSAKILPIDEKTEVPNALKYYHELPREEEFIHDGFSVERISPNLISTTESHRHKLDPNLANLTYRNMYCYVEFSETLDWSDYGFFSE